jgi:hypothetical protein
VTALRDRWKLASLDRALRPDGRMWIYDFAGLRPAASGPLQRGSAAAWTGRSSAPDGSPPPRSSVSQSKRRSPGQDAPILWRFGEASDPLLLGCPRAAGVPGIRRAHRLDEQEVCFLVRAWAVLDAARHDEELTFV